MTHSGGPAEEVVALLAARGKTLCLAESCTGGLIAEKITRVPGASLVFAGGFVAYTREAKAVMLGVQCTVMDDYGLVSEEVAAEMARGALEKLPADIVLSVTGLAGPGGDEDWPLVKIGAVCFAVGKPLGETYTVTMNFSGGRQAVREQAADAALGLLLRTIEA